MPRGPIDARLQVGAYASVKATHFGLRWAQTHYPSSWTSARCVGRISKVLVKSGASAEVPHSAELQFVDSVTPYVVKLKDLMFVAESGAEPELFRTPAYELEISEFTSGSELDTDNDDYDEPGEPPTGSPDVLE